MTGPEPATSPFAGTRRRRPLIRRLFYREAAFAVLGPAELRAIYAAFSCVVRLHRVVLYWVHALADDELLVSRFCHPSMYKYSGLELVHLTPHAFAYYRLPGARVGGRGRVAPGAYPISVRAPGRRRHLLRLRKCRHGEIHLDGSHLDGVGERPTDAAAFRALDRHVLDRSKFADEMRAVVERGLEWDYQRALLGEPSSLTEADQAELVETCAGISPRADALLDRLGGRLDAGREARGGQA